MSNISSSNIVYQNIHLTDELKISLEYNVHVGLLNIFVKNIGLPSPNINILSNQYENFQQNLENKIINVSMREEDEPKICIELSNIYVYDLIDADENENNLCQTMITSSSSSSCFDEQSMDNDDGYSTHSHDDIEQQQRQPSKSIIPYQHHYYSDDNVSSIHRLIEELMWLSPFKKTVEQMMNNYLFN